MTSIDTGNAFFVEAGLFKWTSSVSGGGGGVWASSEPPKQPQPTGMLQNFRLRNRPGIISDHDMVNIRVVDVCVTH